MEAGIYPRRSCRESLKFDGLYNLSNRHMSSIDYKCHGEVKTPLPSKVTIKNFHFIGSTMEAGIYPRRSCRKSLQFDGLCYCLKRLVKFD